jgi:hypothetical protein
VAEKEFKDKRLSEKLMLKYKKSFDNNKIKE